MNHTAQFFKNIPLMLSSFNRARKDLPLGFSFNLADRCPIGCDCYWRAQARVQELNDKEVVNFFCFKRDEGYNHVTIVGGEPYVRPKLLAKVAPIMRASWVVTSGTTPLLHFPKTTHFISVDGADSQTHNSVRKSPGLYERILHNLSIARRDGKFPAYIHTVLNAKNYHQIQKILSVWRKNGLVDGVIFSTMTPIKDSGDESLRLSHGQRVWIVENLLRVKREFGNFLCMTPVMIETLHPEQTRLRTPDNCGVAQYVPSYDASGTRMKQCILSDKADCSGCGCVVTALADTFVSKKLRGVFGNTLVLSGLIQ